MKVILSLLLLTQACFATRAPVQAESQTAVSRVVLSEADGTPVCEVDQTSFKSVLPRAFQQHSKPDTRTLKTCGREEIEFLRTMAETYDNQNRVAGLPLFLGLTCALGGAVGAGFAAFFEENEVALIDTATLPGMLPGVGYILTFFPKLNTPMEFNLATARFMGSMIGGLTFPFVYMGCTYLGDKAARSVSYWFQDKENLK